MIPIINKNSNKEEISFNANIEISAATTPILLSGFQAGIGKSPKGDFIFLELLTDQLKVTIATDVVGANALIKALESIKQKLILSEGIRTN